MNYHQIAGVRFYVNYGIYGKAASDSLWISDIVLSNKLLSIFSPNDKQYGKLDIYPNPASTHIKINSNPIKGNIKVQIVNIAGMLVKELIANAGSEIPIADLPKGFYSIKITSQTTTLVGNFIKL